MPVEIVLFKERIVVPTISEDMLKPYESHSGLNFVHYYFVDILGQRARITRDKPRYVSVNWLCGREYRGSAWGYMLRDWIDGLLEEGKYENEIWLTGPAMITALKQLELFEVVDDVCGSTVQKIARTRRIVFEIRVDRSGIYPAKTVVRVGSWQYRRYIAIPNNDITELQGNLRYTPITFYGEAPKGESKTMYSIYDHRLVAVGREFYVYVDAEIGGMRYAIISVPQGATVEFRHPEHDDAKLGPGTWLLVHPVPLLFGD